VREHPASRVDRKNGKRGIMCKIDCSSSIDEARGLTGKKTGNRGGFDAVF
jgi:hypothetical protein